VPDGELEELAGVIAPLCPPEFANQKNPAASTAMTSIKTMPMPNFPISLLYRIGVDKFRPSAILEPIPKTIGFAARKGGK
jgi:hypothetical protein